MSTEVRPLFPEVGVLALVYHHWGKVWLTPHHVLPRLANYFHVVWSEPPHEWRQVLKSVENRIELTVQSGVLTPPGFHCYVPEPWLPTFYRPEWMGRYTFRQRLKHGIARLRREGCRKFVLYLWHHQFEGALRSGDFDVKLYHIDDEYSFLPTPPPICPSEQRVLEGVDQVFVVSPALLERKGGINPETTFMPEGVDYALYATPTPEPADMVTIPRPRIGYTGSLKLQLDWPLLRELALRHSEWQFVFVGPVKTGHGIDDFVRQMDRFQNVHFLGAKNVTDLAAYPQHFDVCIMPYKINGYTNNIYPLKLHEYLASGRPIVSSPIRSIRDFSSVIGLAESPSDWSRSIIRSLQPVANAAPRVAARRRIAQEHDWKKLIYDLAGVICDRLGPHYSAQFEKLDMRFSCT